MSSREPGTMTEYWPTSGNVALRMSVLMVDRHLEQWTMPLSGLLCTNINIDDNASGFIVGILNFSCYGWSCSRIYLCDHFAIKASDSETHTGPSGQRHSARALLVCCWRESLLWVVPDGEVLQSMCLNSLNSSWFISFSCCSWSIFPLINPRHEYKKKKKSPVFL